MNLYSKALVWAVAYYLSIRLAPDGPGRESPLSLRALGSDLLTRPLSALHIASTRSAVGRCGNFAAPFATFGDFHSQPDHLVFSPGNPYNAPNGAPPVRFRARYLRCDNAGHRPGYPGGAPKPSHLRASTPPSPILYRAPFLPLLMLVVCAGPLLALYNIINVVETPPPHI